MSSFQTLVNSFKFTVQTIANETFCTVTYKASYCVLTVCMNITRVTLAFVDVDALFTVELGEAFITLTLVWSIGIHAF